MESIGSSPNYRKENSHEGGSECDDNISFTSSTGKSAINGPFAPRLKNSGIKYKSSSKKTLKNFGSVRSFRRRVKTRLIQSPAALESDDATGPLVDSSTAPRYLKATSSSQGKKMPSHLSPRHSESPFGSNDRNSSPLSQSNLGSLNRKPLPTPLRSSSIRKVRILMKKTSFKPRRTALDYAKVTENVSVDRATYSSIIKDSKFPEEVEIHHGGAESEKLSAMKVCRYHHCSLHGGCHGTQDSAPQPKRSLYRRRWSLKKQWSMKPKTGSCLGAKQSGDRQKELEESRMTVAAEPSDQESVSNGATFSGVENRNAADSPAEIYSEQEADLFGDNYGSSHESDLFEVAFGETSFPERSYQDNLIVLRKYSFEAEDDRGTFSGLNGRCSRCSCHNQGQVTLSTHERADADLSLLKSSSSVPNSGDDVEIPQNGYADVLGMSSSFDKPKEQVIDHVEDDDATLNCANESSNEAHAATPVRASATENNGVSYSPSDSQISSHVNSDEEGDVKTRSTADGDSKVDETVEDSPTDSSARKGIGSKLQFSKQRHVSMWHLIHQHMSSNIGAESPEKPLLGAAGESTADDACIRVAKEISASGRDLSHSHVAMEETEPEIQDIEVRKLFAIKLVREAIEKILLPEVHDQGSDDQSIASESTPRTEFVERTQSQVFEQENYGENDADIGKATAMEECRLTDDASGSENKETADAHSRPEIERTEGKIARKSEKKAPKHWSNLKKWFLLQKFIRALEKVRKFNTRKPQHLPLNPDPEAEKVSLRPQTVDERKNAEEWMLDYALQQAVSQLAPTQKKKVALLVKAFETVVPPQEDAHFRISCLKDNDVGISGIINKVNESVSEAPGSENGQLSSTGQSSIFDENGKSGVQGNTLYSACHSDAVNRENIMANGTEREAMHKLQGLREAVALDCIEEKKRDGDLHNVQMERKNHIKMWHMVYQHVVSDIAEKIGSRLLEGSDDDDSGENKLPVMNNGDYSNGFPKRSDELNNLRSGFTKSDVLKLIKDAVDEIIRRDIQDDCSDAQSITSESNTDMEISQRNFSETEGQNMWPEDEIVMNGITSKKEGEEAESQVKKNIEPSKSKNWSKVKKLMLLKKSIKALEKARNIKTQTRQMLPQMPDPEPERIELRRQMMDARRKAEQWMLDYAVQHIVTKLTPARKRRVFMLVEAFEAVVPFPET